MLAAAPASEAGRGIARAEPARRGARRQMCEAAVRLVKAAGYYNAGTCEFLRRQGQQVLLHRGQRPHSGRASGDGTGDGHRPGSTSRFASPPARSWPLRRTTIVQRGVAIECRINAEDPAADFRPSPGTINALASARRPRRAPRHARRRRLPRAAQLRFDDRQAAGPPADARRGAGHHAARPGGIRRRGHQDDDSPSSAKSSTTPPSSKGTSIPRSSNGSG